MTVGQQQVGRVQSVFLNIIRYLAGIAAAVNHDTVFLVVPGDIAVCSQFSDMNDFQIHCAIQHPKQAASPFRRICVLL